MDGPDVGCLCNLSVRRRIPTFVLQSKPSVSFIMSSTNQPRNGNSSSRSGGGDGFSRGSLIIAVMVIIGLVMMLMERNVITQLQKQQQHSGNSSINIVVGQQQQQQGDATIRSSSSSSLQRPKPLRIVIMYIGAPRTITQEGLLKSHVTNVIEAVGNHGLDVIDVFGF